MAGFADIDFSAELAQRVCRHEQDAQAEAYRVLSPAVMSMSLRILQDRGQAEEVVQDTFIEMIEHASSVTQPAALVGWVRRIAVNHCLMRLRSPWHSRRSALTLVDGADVPMPRDVMADGRRMEALHDVEYALSLMPAETRLVIWLHDVEGYTHKEIGTLVGKTASYSKSQLTRGYEALLNQLGGKDDTETDTFRPACSP